jgi:acyl-CoA thioester hydrolase
LKNPPTVQKIIVRYQDLDPYGHVNNAVHFAYFEAARLAYWRVLGDSLSLGPLEAGDLLDVRYVVAEGTAGYKAPIYLEDDLHSAASIRTIGNRSFTMDYELRAGESFAAGRTVADGTSAQVFYDPRTEEVRPRPDWFLPAVAAAIEGRPEDSFAPESR